MPKLFIVSLGCPKNLSDAEVKALQSHPQIGHDLLERIPRLEEAAEIVAYQEKLYDGRGFPEDDRSGERIPLGSRILKLALDWDTLISGGMSEEMAMAQINDRQDSYDPAIVDALRNVLNIRDVHVLRHVRIHEMVDGAILADDVRSLRGTLLCARGQEITPSMRARLRNYLVNVGIQGPIGVFVSIDEASRSPETPRVPGDEKKPKRASHKSSEEPNWADLCPSDDQEQLPESQIHRDFP